MGAGRSAPRGGAQASGGGVGGRRPARAERAGAAGAAGGVSAAGSGKRNRSAAWSTDADGAGTRGRARLRLYVEQPSSAAGRVVECAVDQGGDAAVPGTRERSSEDQRGRSRARV